MYREGTTFMMQITDELNLQIYLKILPIVDAVSAGIRPIPNKRKCGRAKGKENYK